jgi:PBS lyase HEAT-like repeat
MIRRSILQCACCDSSFTDDRLCNCFKRPQNPQKPAASGMQLVATLLDEAGPLPARYAAMFALRNRGGGEAIEALGRSFAARSALLKHEVAYVLGQMQDAGAIAVLRCASAAACMTRTLLHLRPAVALWSACAPLSMHSLSAVHS